jgi:hypothetical protein
LFNEPLKEEFTEKEVSDVIFPDKTSGTEKIKPEQPV